MPVDLFKKILITELNDILAHYNRAGLLDEPVEKYDAIFKGLNLLWKAASKLLRIVYRVLKENRAYQKNQAQ